MALYLGANKVSFQQGDVTAFLQLQDKTVSPTTSLQTITADSGYHALQSVKINAIPTMTLPTVASGSASGTLKATINRSTSNQYINIPTGYNTAASYYLISATPNGSVTAPSSISGTSASVSTGTNTLTLSKTISVTPNVTTAGYISVGTAGNSSVSLTASITTKAAATYTPTTSNQTISSGQYLTGVQTIKGDANLLANNIKNGVTIFNVAGTYNGPEDDITDAVKFIDYDGTVLHSYSAAQFLALNALPTNPSHSGLTAQGWNWTLADAKAYVTQWGFLDIGQMYTTSSGATEIDIELLKGRTEPYLKIAVNGSVTVNWGDGSTSTITGTSYTSAIATQHSYTNPGNYTIKITINNGGWSLYPNGTYSIIQANSLPSTNMNHAYSVSVKAIRIGSGDVRFAYGACANMYNLEYITIPNTVTMSSIYSVFSGCYKLKTVIFPITSGNITFNSVGVFSSCYSLKYICFSNKLTSAYYSQIEGCYNLREIYFPNGCVITGGGLTVPTNLQKTLARVIIPYRNIKNISLEMNITSTLNGLTTIYNSQFSGVNFLRTVSIPNSVTTIEGYAFSDTYGLSSVTLPNNSSILSNTRLFYNCYSLTTINFPTNLSSLNSGIFENCYALTSCSVPNSLTSIGSDFLDHCYCMESVTFPNTITSFGNYCCSYNCILKNITLPTSLTTIGTYCFQYCYRFTNITIPSGVTSIGNYSFQYCYGLKEVHMQSTTPPTIGQYTFRNLPADCTIYVPSASLSAYQSATNWAQYASQMVGV